MVTTLDILNRETAAKNTSPIVKSFLAHAMCAESGGNANAQCSTSSAGGLFQFVDQTWLGMIHDTGKANGYGNFAEQIYRGKDGKWHGKTPEIERQILALKKDPTAACRMGIEYAEKNATAIKNSGVEVTEGNLYLAHFLGSFGAIKVLHSNPNLPLSEVVGAGVMSSNKGIRLDYKDRDGNDKRKSFASFTVGDLRAWAAKKMGGRINYDLLDREVQSDVDRWEGENENPRNNFRTIGDMSFGEILVMAIVGMLSNLFAGSKAVPNGTNLTPSSTPGTGSFGVLRSDVNVPAKPVAAITRH